MALIKVRAVFAMEATLVEIIFAALRWPPSRPGVGSVMVSYSSWN